MQRICTALVSAGYRVTLVGRLLPSSLPLQKQIFHQERIRCRFHKGKLFYIEYNFRLYYFLRKKWVDAICAIDLDTIIPCYFISKKKKIPRVCDAHEFFSELTEIRRRPFIFFLWKSIERWMLPKFPIGYTVCQSIAEEFSKQYGVKYHVVRNLPLAKNTGVAEELPQNLLDWWQQHRQFRNNLPVIAYQGAINEGRALIELVAAMDQVDGLLIMAGDGNVMEEVRAAVSHSKAANRIFMTGYLRPGVLKTLTPQVTLGINLVENTGLNQYYSLANKFFDYIMAGIPQVCMAYPEYNRFLDQFNIGIGIPDVQPTTIANAINNLLHNHVVYQAMQLECKKAASLCCWENEIPTLVQVWQQLIPLTNATSIKATTVN